MSTLTSTTLLLGVLTFVLPHTEGLFPEAYAEDALSSVAVREIDPVQAAKVSYTREIKPLLDQKCVGCHAGKRPKGLYDVTTVENLKKEGGSAGPGVVPGKPDESAVVHYVRGISQPRMPKDEPPLSEDEVHLIRQWIAAGAVEDTSSTQVSANVPEGAALQAPSLEGVDVQKEIQSLLFIADPVEQLIRKREIRLRYLPPPPSPPEVKAPVYNPIDRFIAARWEADPNQELCTLVPEVCDDPVFLRRAYLDVIGRIPSVEETEKFLADSAPRKREALVDDLLSRNADYAAHWTPFWEDALCSNGNHQGGVGTHGNYRDWAYKNFEQNKPYDVMAAELIDPSMPNHPQRYVLNNDHMKTVQSAANTAQVFLGTGLKCASCHNHFENKEWTQTRFYGYAGFFSPADMELIRCEEHTGQFMPTQFIFDLPDMPTEVPKDQDGRLKRVAQLLVDPTNPRFAKTLVNRLWKRHLGLGLFEPVDDFRLDRPPSHPDLLEWLADDFMRHGYDIKHTIRLIMTSRTYQLAYSPALEDHYDVGKPTEPRYFRSPALRRLTAEQFLDSLMQAAGTPGWRGKGRTYQDDESTPLTRVLGRPSTRNEVSTARSEDAAVVQALELLNGEEYYERIYSSPLLSQLLPEADLGHVVDMVYLRALNRTPQEEERTAGVSFMKESLSGVGEEALKSTEVVWIEDDLPSGGQVSGTSKEASWRWVTSPDGPVYSGTRSHAQNGSGPQVQHFVIGAEPGLETGPEDHFFAYVYLDPANPPKEIMMQWHTNDWEHRAFWGENKIPYGEGAGASHVEMGPLPEAGQWIRLEVPAARVGVQGSLVGWSFDQAGGTVYWDKAGVLKNARNPKTEAIGDLLWAFVTSPGFQYIY